MDSKLLDQIRYLCRDRAAYERLKVILVQQERVHQFGQEKHDANLVLTKASPSSSADILSNADVLNDIVAREKALAQLADTIQRSPSLDLVLQVAVQVAQKLLQVDRVAIFRGHPDGRGEFVTDAIARGVTSLADMPERQLSLARHMIESTDIERPSQTIDSISSSSLSSHIVTLLEQIGISSYAANKIYAAQQIWGTVVAFHSNDQHIWAESDRTSLSLISSQIGIAISLTNLRHQSQELTDDLHTLQNELDKLQQTVVEIAESKTSSISLSNILSNPSNFTPITDLFPDIIIKPEITESEITESEITESEITESEITESEITESEITESEQALDEEDNKPQKVVSNFTQEIANLKNSPAFQRTFPKLSLVPEANSKPPRRNLKPSLYNWLGFSFVRKKISKKSSQNLPQREKINPFLPEVKFLDEDALIIEEIAAEKSVPNEPAGITFNQDDISYIVIPDNLKIVAVDQEEEIITEKSFVTEMPRSQSTELALLAMELSQEIEQQSTPPTPELIDEDEEPVIDPQFMKMILMIAGDDHKGIEFLLNVIDSYLEEAPRLVQNIDKALAINSHARLLQSLNTLRLSSEYIGAVRLSYQCRQLESAVKANYVVLIYACLSRVAIELQQVTDSLRIERSRYT